MSAERERLIGVAAAALQALRAQAPRVQCLTNTVAQPITANLLLAIGARVSMASYAEEIADMAKGADAVLINLGMLDEARVLSIPRALAAIDPKRQPVVLDPVFVELSPLRMSLAASVIGKAGPIVRGNATEMAALAAAMPADLVRATTGKIDRVADRARTIDIANGHPYMARVTGMGCAAGALIAAFAAVVPDRLDAAVAALLSLGLAGEIAAEKAHGTGTFAAHIIDAIGGLDAATLATKARLA